LTLPGTLAWNAALCGFCAVVLQAASNQPPNASEFYIVSTGYSDGLPGWHHSILEVKPDGDDIRVRYIRVSPFSVDCGQAALIGAASARLQNTSLDAVTGGVNLCAIDQPSLNHAIRAFPQRQQMSVFGADRCTIVAKCRTDTRVIRLPEDWQIDMTRLKRKRPRIAALWTLENVAGTRAFGRFNDTDTVPPQMAAQLQPADKEILSELKSGSFDAGFAPRSFKDDVAALRASSDPVDGVKLINPDHFHFAHYVTPQYSPLAKQARISGAVELELTSNPATGEVEQVTVVSGPAILSSSAADAARQWRFLPGSEGATRAARAVLEFVFHCP
jgi:hypothetical protein